MKHEFKAQVWLYPGEAAWHFLTLPKELSQQLRFEQGPDFHRPMIKVEARIGKTIWKTSIFWDKKAASFLLPLKAEIRKKEAIQVGNTLNVSLHLILY